MNFIPLTKFILVLAKNHVGIAILGFLSPLIILGSSEKARAWYKLKVQML